MTTKGVVDREPIWAEALHKGGTPTWSRQRPNKENGNMGRKLYVGNLAFEVTQKDLEELFAQAGSCDSVAVISDRATGQSRGFGN